VWAASWRASHSARDRARAVSHCQCRIFRCICACTREISALTKTDLSTQPAMDPVAMQAIAKLAVTGPGLSRGAQRAVIGPASHQPDWVCSVVLARGVLSMTRMGPRGVDSGRWMQPIGPCHVQRRPRLGGGVSWANQWDMAVVGVRWQGGLRAWASVCCPALCGAAAIPLVSERTALDASITAWARAAVVAILCSLLPSVITAAVSCCRHPAPSHIVSHTESLIKSRTGPLYENLRRVARTGSTPVTH